MLLLIVYPKWLVKVDQAKYVDDRSRTCANTSFSEEFEVGVHQGSVLSLLLFAVVLEVLTQISVGCPRKMLYTDYLVITAETFEGLTIKMAVWKNDLEPKEFKVNMGKTKVIISSRDLQTLQSSGKLPLCNMQGSCQKKLNLLQWMFFLASQKMF